MDEFENYLCSELKNYRDVIIYGYADIGTCILDYIIDFETSIKIANYSGRVRYFTYSQKNRDSLRKEIKGIKLKSIYDLQEYSKSALVIVATQEKHHKDIAKILKELNFEHCMFIKHEDYCAIRKAVENHQIIVNSNIQNYHLNHQIKLNRLREKTKRGEKVKVFFMTHDAAVFGAASVYWNMYKSKLFEPYIYVVSRRDVGYVAFMDDVDRDVDFFKSKNYRVIKGYDEYGNPKDLHRLKPDILFYDIPKLYGMAGNFYNRLDQLNWEYLTCYIPYGLLMVDSFYYHYHTKCIRETWKFFLDTASSFKRILRDGDFNGFNTVFTGYPKLDDYYNQDEKLPDKLNNGKPLVIYAPHHSLFVSNNFATFDLYKDDMFEFVKTHTEINFVFKPHPLLAFQIEARYNEGKIDFSKKDFEEYMMKWNSLQNGYVETKGDYIKYFKACSCMITDCGSFIGEYFPSGNPCIYLFNPRKKNQEDVYTELAKDILDTYYVARDRDQLKLYLEQVILEKRDDKKENRNNLLKKEFNKLGHSGQDICEYLEREILD